MEVDAAGRARPFYSRTALGSGVLRCLVRSVDSADDLNVGIVGSRWVG